MGIRELTDKMLSDGHLSRQEYQQLLAAIQADGKLDEEERAQIDRIMDMIASGVISVEQN